MAREQFTFYRSFWEAIKSLKKKEDRLSALEAICAYALDGDKRPMTDVANGMFILIKPVLDSAEKKSCGGKTKGSKAEDSGKTKGSKAEDSGKEKEGDVEKEVEGEIEVEVEVEKENECYYSSPQKERKESGSPSPGIETKKYGKYVTLTLAEFVELLGEFGAEGFRKRKEAIDLPENEGADFAALIRGADVRSL